MVVTSHGKRVLLTVPGRQGGLDDDGDDGRGSDGAGHGRPDAVVVGVLAVGQHAGQCGQTRHTET